MPETETPPQDQELPDTPVAEVTMEKVRNLARSIAFHRAEREEHDAAEAKLAEELLPLMAELTLNGIVLEDGVKVRRRSRTTYGKIDPVKLAGRIADAPTYTVVKVEVDKDALVRDYPQVAFELGKPKTSTFHQVVFPKAPKGGA